MGRSAVPPASRKTRACALALKGARPAPIRQTPPRPQGSQTSPSTGSLHPPGQALGVSGPSRRSRRLAPTGRSASRLSRTSQRADKPSPGGQSQLPTRALGVHTPAAGPAQAPRTGDADACCGTGPSPARWGCTRMLRDRPKPRASSHKAIDSSQLRNSVRNKSVRLSGVEELVLAKRALPGLVCRSGPCARSFQPCTPLARGCAKRVE